MKDTGPLLLLLPLVIPLAGIWAIWVLPSRMVSPDSRRRVHLGILISTCIALWVAKSAEVGTARLPFWGPLSAYGEPLEFSLDSLSFAFSLLLVGSLTVAGLSMMMRPIERFESVSALLLVEAGIGVCAASNLLTLCLAWMLMDVALLSMDIVRVPDESIPHAARNVLVNLCSTLALIVVTTLTLSQRGEGQLSGLALSGLPLKLLAIASLLRLGIYPLPGGLKRRWEVYLASLCTGGYLWLRLITLSPGEFPGVGGLVFLGCGSLVITGLLAGFSSDLATALPYVLSHGIAAFVLAPLLVPDSGYAIAFVTAINLALCLTLLRADAQVRPVSPWGRRARLPLMIALASLAGWPLTLGFIAHWSLLKLFWVMGPQSMVWLGSLSYLCCSIPLWQRFRYVLREIRDESALPRWGVQVAFFCAAAVAVVLVVAGIYLPFSGRTWSAWPEQSAAAVGLQPVSFGALIGGSVATWAVLALGAVIVPFVGSYAVQRLWAAVPGGWVQRVDATGALLELDWLYAAADRVLARIWSLSTRGLSLIEESLYLGWTLIWVLVVVLYLVGG